MCLNLNDCQFKTSGYSYQSTYMNLMVTTNKKPSIDTPKLGKKEHKHSANENCHATRKKTKKENNRRTTKTTRKKVIKWQ